MELLRRINNAVWGIPTLMLIMGVGVILTIMTKFAQIRLLPRALRAFFRTGMDKKDANNGQSSFRSLCTALAATVGTGNLAGVAGAIAIGGPGAVFWIWVGGILGMITKFAEAVLAVHYRVQGKRNEYLGGPMYVIMGGLPKRMHFLAYVYAFFGVVAAFGVGNATQINTVICSLDGALSYFGKEPSATANIILGVFMAFLVALLFFGGAKRIGSATETLVPFASILYIILGIGVLILRFSEIPNVISTICKGAFAPKAVTGGVVGSFLITLRIGASRGVFTNEAGMGTAGIAHASANVRHPVEQGLMGIVEVFIDTIVICTITALVILCSGVPIGYGQDLGVALTAEAFSSVYGGWITLVLTGALCCFAFATILGWGLYGARCAQFLFGENAWSIFAAVQGITVLIGTVLKTSTVWLLADIVNGLMAIPNLIAMCMLLPKVRKLVREYDTNKENLDNY